QASRPGRGPHLAHSAYNLGQTPGFAPARIHRHREGVIDMARFTRLEVLNAVIDSGLVPIFYHADAEVAKQVAKAVHAGGARVLEFTNRGDFAFQVFTDLAQYCAAEMPAMILGVGSVVDAPTASMY